MDGLQIGEKGWPWCGPLGFVDPTFVILGMRPIKDAQAPEALRCMGSEIAVGAQARHNRYDINSAFWDLRKSSVAPVCRCRDRAKLVAFADVSWKFSQALPSRFVAWPLANSWRRPTMLWAENSAFGKDCLGAQASAGPQPIAASLDRAWLGVACCS